MAAPGVLGTGVNAQGYPLTAVLVAGPAYGSVVLNPDGSFLYTPAAGYSGPDSFTYQANDGVTVSNAATVSITVIGLHTMVWQGSASGNWTGAGQWTGAPPAYPDVTANVVLDTPDSVQVNSAQAANSLQISNGGQVEVAAGGSLTVTTDTGVTAGGVLGVNANGAFSTGGALTLDTGGSLSGGSVSAAAFQFDDGTAGANLSGPGGLTKDTGGTVLLSGSNTYTGGTTVLAGSLLVQSGGAIPHGSLLSIGAEGSVVLGDPGYAEQGLVSGGQAAPSAEQGAGSGEQGAMDERTAGLVAAPVASRVAVSAATVVTVSAPVSAPAAAPSARSTLSPPFTRFAFAAPSSPVGAAAQSPAPHPLLPAPRSLLPASPRPLDPSARCHRPRRRAAVRGLGASRQRGELARRPAGPRRPRAAGLEARCRGRCRRPALRRRRSVVSVRRMSVPFFLAHQVFTPAGREAIVYRARVVMVRFQRAKRRISTRASY
jgi:autotransporter-associated beta strand protein